MDCGILSPYLDQRVIPFGFEDGYLRRPDFKFKLWFETDREFENLQQYKKNVKKENTIDRKLHKTCLQNHFFYSADRNMKTHFSIHHSVNKILKAPALLLHILYDSKEYLNKIASSQPEHYLGLPFLQKKLEFIFSSICLFLFPEDSNKSWDSVFDNYGIILDPKMINFNLVNDFGQEFYTRLKYFLEIMLTGQAYWMNELDFQLLIYLVYIILNLAQHDASNTKNITIDFNHSQNEKEQWRKINEWIEIYEKKRDRSTKTYIMLRPHPYSVFTYQLGKNIKSKYLNDFVKLPLTAAIYLHNGKFDSLPPYIKNMKGLIEDVKKLLKIKSMSENPETQNRYKATVIKRWDQFAKRNFRQSWEDIIKFVPEIKFNNPIHKFYSEDYESAETKQKIFFIWFYHIKCRFSIALSDDGLRIEFFIGVKSGKNKKPICSFTANSRKMPDELNDIFKEIYTYIPKITEYRQRDNLKEDEKISNHNNEIRHILKKS